MFDKKEYRKRREAGLRGQDDMPVTKQPAKKDNLGWRKRLGIKALLKNTKRSRKLANHLEADGGITT